MSRNSALQQDVRANLLAWIVDLETTDAKQGREHLYEGGKYCCLGRALVVLGGKFSNRPFVRGDEGSSYQWLTDEELTSLGLTREDHDNCYKLNDDKEKTFSEIAAWLRENVLPRYPEKAAVGPTIQRDPE